MNYGISSVVLYEYDWHISVLWLHFFLVLPAFELGRAGYLLPSALSHKHAYRLVLASSVAFAMLIGTLLSRGLCSFPTAFTM